MEERGGKRGFRMAMAKKKELFFAFLFFQKNPGFLFLFVFVLSRYFSVAYCCMFGCWLGGNNR